MLNNELAHIAVRAEAYLHLVFDFVHISDKRGQNQISTAWTALPLDKLTSGSKKLTLKGGSPFDRFDSPIVTAEEQAREKEGMSGFKRLFGGDKASLIDRHISMQVKGFTEMTQTT